MKSLIIIIIIGIPLLSLSQNYYKYTLKDDRDRLGTLEIDTKNNLVRWATADNVKYMDIVHFRDGKSPQGKYFQDLKLQDRNGDPFILLVFESTMTVELFNRKGEYVAIFSIIPSSELKSSGTGYAISSNGYIATNYHVTGGASTIKVRGINGNFSKSYTAVVVIEDKKNDLAIIKINDSSFTSLGTIPYIITNYTSDVGSSAFVLGYPLRATMGDEVKLTNGIISSKSGFQGDVASYQTTVPIQSGNSGGPLFNSKGNVIGIVNAKHAGAENASYAIKSMYLLNLINQMPDSPKLQTISTVSDKSLPEQVKILKKFIYIIEIN